MSFWHRKNTADGAVSRPAAPAAPAAADAHRNRHLDPKDLGVRHESRLLGGQHPGTGQARPAPVRPVTRPAARPVTHQAPASAPRPDRPAGRAVPGNGPVPQRPRSPSADAAAGRQGVRPGVSQTIPQHVSPQRPGPVSNRGPVRPEQRSGHAGPMPHMGVHPAAGAARSSAPFHEGHGHGPDPLGHEAHAGAAENAAAGKGAAAATDHGGAVPAPVGATLTAADVPVAQDAAAAAPRFPARGHDGGGIDWWLFVLVVMLLGVGLVMVLSASGIVAEADFHDKYHFFKRQLGYALAGAAGMTVAALMPRELLFRLHYPAIFFSLFLLLLTLSPLAPSINGAHRWLKVGPVTVQPMELVKVSMAMYLAYFLSVKHGMVKTLTRGILPPFLVTLLFCGLLILQPDFGSTVLLLALFFVMCLAAGIRFIYMVAVFAGCVGVCAALVILEPYRMRRLMAFLDPFKDAHDTGYQLVQSLLAIGSGSFFGVGIGASRQKMFYLPEAHNDFIMAVLAEEMGFLGVSVVMLLFLCLFWRCYLVVRGQEDLRARYTAFALTCIVAFGVMLNLAVVMGMAPPKGVPMPLLSYGGSNLVATMFTLGLILNFSRTARNERL